MLAPASDNLYHFQAMTNLLTNKQWGSISHKYKLISSLVAEVFHCFIDWLHYSVHGHSMLTWCYIVVWSQYADSGVTV